MCITYVDRIYILQKKDSFNKILLSYNFLLEPEPEPEPEPEVDAPETPESKILTGDLPPLLIILPLGV